MGSLLGDWQVEIVMTGGGGKGILAVAEEPDGVAVRFLSSQGVEAKLGSQAMAWTGVTVDGDALRGETKVEGMPVPTVFTLELQVDGDTLTGSLGFGPLGTGTITGTRT